MELFASMVSTHLLVNVPMASLDLTVSIPMTVGRIRVQPDEFVSMVVTHILACALHGSMETTVKTSQGKVRTQRQTVLLIHSVSATTFGIESFCGSFTHLSSTRFFFSVVEGRLMFFSCRPALQRTQSVPFNETLHLQPDNCRVQLCLSRPLLWYVIIIFFFYQNVFTVDRVLSVLVGMYKARHAHKRLYTVLPKYSKIQVLPGITSCRLMKYNKQAIELNSLLINNMPKDGYE